MQNIGYIIDWLRRNHVYEIIVIHHISYQPFEQPAPEVIAHRILFVGWFAGWLCFTSHLQRGHLETAHPFTVPCEGREPRFLDRSHREPNPGPDSIC